MGRKLLTQITETPQKKTCLILTLEFFCIFQSHLFTEQAAYFSGWADTRASPSHGSGSTPRLRAGSRECRAQLINAAGAYQLKKQVQYGVSSWTSTLPKGKVWIVWTRKTKMHIWDIKCFCRKKTKWKPINKSIYHQLLSLCWRFFFCGLVIVWLRGLLDWTGLQSLWYGRFNFQINPKAVVFNGGNTGLQMRRSRFYP